MFEGVRGSGYTGDIAIDDITLDSGPCDKAPDYSPPVRHLQQELQQQ